MALRVIRRDATFTVAIGLTTDIGRPPALKCSVANDPKETSGVRVVRLDKVAVADCFVEQSAVGCHG